VSLNLLKKQKTSNLRSFFSYKHFYFIIMVDQAFRPKNFAAMGGDNESELDRDIVLLDSIELPFPLLLGD
jgi:hypothetical protein